MLIAIVFDSSIARPIPLNRNIPARVQIKGGMWIYPIQKPCHIPISTESTRQMIMTRYAFILCFDMSWAAMAPTRQTVEPTERSILPPVSIHKSIPQAITSTYAFWSRRFERFCASRSFCSVHTAKEYEYHDQCNDHGVFFDECFDVHIILLRSFISYPTEG